MVRRGRGTVTMSGSVFCTLRDPWPWPTCAYVAGALGRHLELHGLTAEARIEGCHAQGGASCTLTVVFDAPPAGEPT